MNVQSLPLAEHPSMETLSAVAVWGYQETSEEMKSMLWATVCELEQVRNNVREEMKKKEDFINQLVNLLKTVNQERDEAKEQLQTLLNKLKQLNSVEQQFSADHPFLWPTENPQPNQAWASFITEDSANLSQVGKNSHCPELASISNVSTTQQPLMNSCAPPAPIEDDLMEEIFHRLAKKPLPEKGRFLETVMNAGPLLDTLLVAGTLPRWRNPPPLKPFLFPPMLSIRGNNLATKQSASLNPSYLMQNLDAGLKDSRPSPMRYCGAGNKQCMVAKRQKLT